MERNDEYQKTIAQFNAIIDDIDRRRSKFLENINELESISEEIQALVKKSSTDHQAKIKLNNLIKIDIGQSK